MNKRPMLAEILQRAIDVHFRYYSSLGRLALDSLGVLFGTVFTLQSESPRRFAETNGRSPANLGQQQRASTLVLEGEAGSRPMGVFLIENGLAQEICTSIVSSVFTDPAGKEMQPKFRFEPRTIRLAPKEQVLIRMGVLIGESLRPNVNYRGEVSVPDLPGTRIPVVLRRTGSASGSQAVQKQVRKRNAPTNNG
jgi:hypothetical protein